ncbi:NaeI family type II restriction endonuclease [Herbidospora yilanensis]|uniref:NaeI family type II restriction endonuclease n=1 Tax=Herbidospora yilanensis TaxID=354426 RepID=UPI000A69A3F6|nr:NaeI family type II restriction endonuclease [Herbidospora yilanensis]
MAKKSSGVGRPRSPLRGASEEVNQVALLLQRQLRDAGMTVRGLCALFTPEHFRHRPVPRHSTVTQRLNGVDLEKDWLLIEAIISICTPPAQAKDVTKQVKVLLEMHRQAPTLPVPDVVGGAVNSDQQIVDLQNEVRHLGALHAGLADEFRQMRKLLEGFLRNAGNPAAGDSEPPGSPGSVGSTPDHAPRPMEPPELKMGKSPPSPGSPDDVERVVAAFTRMDLDGRRVGRVLRGTVEQLLDGMHTGRYRWEQLMRSEKMVFRDLVHVSLAREFALAEGVDQDFRVDDVEFVLRVSASHGWMIGADDVGRVGVLLSFDHGKSLWSMGVTRFRRNFLSGSMNRDGKTRLSREGMESVRWLHLNAPLPANVLTMLRQDEVDAIFSLQSGQQRINDLFRRTQRIPVTRDVLATVAMQGDYMKRLRGNGGARSALRSEGIVILGAGANHARIAAALLLPVLDRGEFLAVRLARHGARHSGVPSVELDGERWVVASDEDPAELAPLVPDDLPSPGSTGYPA